MYFLIAIPPLAALFWSVMLFLKKNRLTAHRVMSVGLFVFFVAYILFCMLFAPWAGMPVAIAFMACALMVPFLHLTFFRLAVDMKRSVKPDVPYLIVVGVLIVSVTVIASTFGPDKANCYYHSVVMGEKDFEVPAAYSSSDLWNVLAFLCFKVYNGLLALAGTGIFIYAFVKIVRYDRYLDDYFSGREIQEKKNNLFVFLSAAFGIVPLILLLAQPFYTIRDNASLLGVCTVLGAAGVFLTGLYAYRINFTAEQLRFMIDEDDEKRKLADEVPQNDVKTSGVIYSETLTRLLHAMDVDKAYLDPEISLVGLSDKLKTNRTYLSKIINLNYDCSFSEFINARRVEYALSIIHERHEHGVSLKDVSAECGYANQASFIRNFTKIVGVTPGEYILQTCQPDTNVY